MQERESSGNGYDLDHDQHTCTVISSLLIGKHFVLQLHFCTK